jgi:hypothetical protein
MIFFKKQKTMRNLSAFFALSLFFAFSFSVRPARADVNTPIPCDSSNAGLDCGEYINWPGSSEPWGTPVTAPLAADKCSISGAGEEHGITVLGGQVCSIGGTDDPGYYHNRTTGQNVPLSDYAGNPPPGWVYNKVSPFTQIPYGAFSDVTNPAWFTDGFYGGTVYFRLSSADDQSSIQIGSNKDSVTGCSCGVADQSGGGCPSTQGSGMQSFPVNGGESVVFNVKNLCAPQSGYGTWGGAQVDSFSLNPLTICYKAAYLESLGGYSNITDYVPTGSGQCSPTSVPRGTINVLSQDTSGNPISSSWTISGPISTSTTGASAQYTKEPMGSYVVRASLSEAPAGYTFVDIAPAETQSLSKDGDTITFTIHWKKNASTKANIACIVSPSSLTVGSSATFKANGGSGSGYVWSIQGAGPSNVSPSGQSVSETFSQAGTGQAIVADDAGDSSLVCSVTVTAPPSNATTTATTTTPGIGSICLDCGKSAPTSTTVTAVTIPPTGSISASPNPCVMASGSSTCTSYITWSTANIPSSDVVNVYVNDNKAPYSPSNPSCSSGSACSKAPWITKSGDTFELDDCTDGLACTKRTKLSSVTVTGVSYAWSGCGSTAVCEDSNGYVVGGSICSGSAPACANTNINGNTNTNIGANSSGGAAYICTATWGCVYNPYSGIAQNTWDALQCQKSCSESTTASVDTYSWSCVFGSPVCEDNQTGASASGKCSGTGSGVCPIPITVSVSPSSANITAGGSLQFTATVSGGGYAEASPEKNSFISVAQAQNSPVIWSTKGGGSITVVGPSTALYTAPSAVTAPLTAYVIAVSTADTSASMQIPIVIYPPASCTIGATPQNIILGTKTTIKWNCQYATSCNLNGQSANPTSGSMTVKPIQNTQYILSCLNAAGSSSQAAVSVGVASNPGIKETTP